MTAAVLFEMVRSRCSGQPQKCLAGLWTPWTAGDIALGSIRERDRALHLPLFPEVIFLLVVSVSASGQHLSHQL